MGDFKHLDVYWVGNTADCTQFRRVLDCVEDNLLIQVLDKATRGEALLDLVLTNANKLIKEVRNGGSVGCSNLGS